MFFGMTVGSEAPDTIWFEKTTLRGLDGIIKFYKTFWGIVYMMEFPIIIICIIYQIIYFKIIRKKFD